jgi:predicted DNA-binding transcriptional regulator AlpA
MNILRYKATAQKCDVNPITIRRWATLPEYADLHFPKPVPLGANSVGFIEAEINEWLKSRADERAGGAV